MLIHQSELLENNTAVVQGRDGVLLVDAGITGDEMVRLAAACGQPGITVGHEDLRMRCEPPPHRRSSP